MLAQLINRASGPGGVRLRAIQTALDHGLVSFVSLATTASLIAFSDPVQYGRYSFLLSSFLLVAAVQNAGINTPTMVLAPRLTLSERTNFNTALFTVLLLGSPIALLAGIASTWASRGQAPQGESPMLAAVVFIPLLFRDYFRAQEFAEFAPHRALRRDTVYAGVATLAITLFAVGNLLTASTALIAIGVGATAALIAPLRSGLRLASRAEVKGVIGRTWPLSRWGLLGATANWFQTNAFIYLPFFLIGANEVAGLAAARAVLMPVTVILQSWANTLRPTASRLLHSGDVSGLRRIIARSLSVFVVGLASYTAFFFLVIQLIPEQRIPEGYQHIGWYVALWAAIVLIQIFRANAASILQASLSFRPLALTQLGIAVLAVTGTATFVPLVGEGAALWVLGISEAVFAAALLAQLRPILHVPTPIRDQGV